MDWHGSVGVPAPELLVGVSIRRPGCCGGASEHHCVSPLVIEALGKAIGRWTKRTLIEVGRTS